jgi:hypothetical protein
MNRKFLLLGAVAALLFAFPAVGAERLPTAGAPHYLHWGPEGLCKQLTEDSVSGIEYDAATRIVAVNGGLGSDFLEVTVDDQGTSSASDDTLEMTLESFDAQGPPDVSVLDPPLPLYDPADGGGGGGVWTTENKPKKLYLKRIEFFGSYNNSNGVTNDSPVPMYARGFFGDTGGVNGFFLGGSGPDCVTATTGKGAGKDNSIDGGGGDDYIKSGFGDDSLTGGQGSDTIIAGEGEDILRGDGGDPIHHDGGVDHLRGEGDSDCYIGSETGFGDGLRDLLDDPAPGWADYNTYVAEPGVIGGVQVDTIDYITEHNPTLFNTC